MWYKSEATDRPEIIDKTSSKVYVYVRKNITEKTRTSERGEPETYFEYDEMKIPKEVYDIIAQQEERLNDIEEVITEIIGG